MFPFHTVQWNMVISRTGCQATWDISLLFLRSLCFSSSGRPCYLIVVSVSMQKNLRRLFEEALYKSALITTFSIFSRGSCCHTSRIIGSMQMLCMCFIHDQHQLEADPVKYNNSIQKCSLCGICNFRGMFGGSFTPLSHPIISHFIPDAYCMTLHVEYTISAITNVSAIMHGKHNFPLQEMVSVSWSTWKTHKVAKSNHPSQNPV